MLVFLVSGILNQLYATYYLVSRTEDVIFTRWTGFIPVNLSNLKSGPIVCSYFMSCILLQWRMFTVNTAKVLNNQVSICASNQKKVGHMGEHIGKMQPEVLSQALCVLTGKPNQYIPQKTANASSFSRNLLAFQKTNPGLLVMSNTIHEISCHSVFKFQSTCLWLSKVCTTLHIKVFSMGL